jgi:hypothetical protein
VITRNVDVDGLSFIVIVIDSTIEIHIPFICDVIPDNRDRKIYNRRGG